MVDKKKVLDEAMRREGKLKLKKLLTYTFLALVFGGVIAFSELKNYDRVKFSKELTGVVQSINTEMIDASQTQAMLVIKLQNNKIIEIPNNEFSPLEQGEQVKVVRQELESGRMRYSIVLN